MTRQTMQHSARYRASLTRAHRTVGAYLCVYRAGHAETMGYAPEVAQNFKEQGNEYFRGNRYREALGFYTQGVDAKPENEQLREALLLNRAACNLELRLCLFSTSAIYVLFLLIEQRITARYCATVLLSSR